MFRPDRTRGRCAADTRTDRDLERTVRRARRRTAVFGATEASFIASNLLGLAAPLGASGRRNEDFDVRIVDDNANEVPGGRARSSSVRANRTSFSRGTGVIRGDHSGAAQLVLPRRRHRTIRRG